MAQETGVFDADFDFITAAELAELDAEAKEHHPDSALLMIGGARSVATAVDMVYPRLLRDRFVAPIFEKLLATDGLSGLKRHMVYMLTWKLGGPNHYKGRDLRSAHAGLGITDDVYRRVCLYILTVLHELGVPMDILCAVDDLFRSVQSLIATGPVEATA